MMIHALTFNSAGQSLAEAAVEVTHESINWVGPEGQLIISTYLLTLVTLTASIVEIYRLIKIEHELKLISRFVRAIGRLPSKARHPVARVKVRRLVRQARRNVIPAPVHIQAEQIMIRDDKPLARSNEGHF